MDASACSVIAALEPHDRARLLDRAVPRRLKRTEALTLTGERNERLHVVTEGVLKLIGRNGSGSESIAGLAVPGDLIGDVAALDGLGQPFDAVAATPCTVVGFSAEVFLDVIENSPRSSFALAENLAARTRTLTETVLERGANEVPARLAARLLDLADVLGRIEGNSVSLDLPIAQGDLGRLAGMSRESACKTLRKFKTQGVVDYRGRRLRILRPDVLEKIRCAGRA